MLETYTQKHITRVLPLTKILEYWHKQGKTYFFHSVQISRFKCFASLLNPLHCNIKQNLDEKQGTNLMGSRVITSFLFINNFATSQWIMVLKCLYPFHSWPKSCMDNNLEKENIRIQDFMHFHRETMFYPSFKLSTLSLSILMSLMAKN